MRRDARQRDDPTNARNTIHEQRATPSRRRRGDKPNHDTDTRLCPIGQLQRSHGNQAVQELHRRGNLQAKLRVSSPNDPAEREAKQVANRVMRMEGTVVETANPPTIQRSVSGCTGGDSVSGEHETQLRSSLGGGKSLPAKARTLFEQRFVRDFSAVRIHTNRAANEAARSIDADGFTIGTDIAFADGMYDHNSRSGRALLAHELTHVTQQNKSVNRHVQLQRETNDQTEGGGGGRRTPLDDTSTLQAASQRPDACNGLFGPVRGQNCSANHAAVDYHADVGTSIYAVTDGRVGNLTMRGYGKSILFRERDGDVAFLYAHLSNWGVEDGATVSRGDEIGETGISGNANADRPHLHFEVHPNGWRDAADPLKHGFPTPNKQRVWNRENGWHVTPFDINDCDCY